MSCTNSVVTHDQKHNSHMSLMPTFWPQPRRVPSCSILAEFLQEVLNTPSIKSINSKPHEEEHSSKRESRLMSVDISHAWKCVRFGSLFWASCDHFLCLFQRYANENMGKRLMMAPCNTMSSKHVLMRKLVVYMCAKCSKNHRLEKKRRCQNMDRKLVTNHIQI